MRAGWTGAGRIGRTGTIRGARSANESSDREDNEQSERNRIDSDISGADASGGNTRSHPEHDREEPDGRKYYAGDGMGG